MFILDDALQGALLDLLGFDNLSFLEELISNRSILIKNTSQIDNNAFKIAKKEIRQTIPAAPKHAPQYGAQVTVMSQSQKLLAKQQRKEQKKLSKQPVYNLEGSSDDSLALDGEYLRIMREQELLMNAEAPKVLKPSTDPIKYPHVYQSGTGGAVLSMFGTRYTLPAGSERNDNADYEQVMVPISRKNVVVSNERRIEIKELDEFSQSAFAGYKSLNRVQSIVFPIAYKTNENMLVCAPTGAGKTDVAMLTILRCLLQYRDNGVLAKNDFKIIYVAPMKALATEITRKFSSRLSHLGIAVRELTGDMQLTKAEISSTQMLVVTPEKFDIVGRKSVGDVELTQVLFF